MSVSLIDSNKTLNVYNKKVVSLLLAVLLVVLVFCTTVVKAETSYTKGIDVSYWQGSIDWKKTASRGIEFAIIRSYAYKADSSFGNNYDQAKAAGIDVGSYVYMYATTEEEARSEAENVLKTINGRNLDYPLYLDVEDSSILSLGKTFLTSLMLIELEMFVNAGYEAGVYTSSSYTSTYMDMSKLTAYDFWVAHWVYNKDYAYLDTVSPDTEYSMKSRANMWQYTSKGDGNYFGMSSQYLDMDYCYRAKKPKCASGSVVTPVYYKLNSFDSTAGITGNSGTKVLLSSNKMRGDSSVSLNNISTIKSCTISYSEYLKFNSYDYLSFWCYFPDAVGAGSRIEISLGNDIVCYRDSVEVTGDSVGWNKYDFCIDGFDVLVDDSYWDKIKTIDISFFGGNNSSTYILLDELAMFNNPSASPSGNVLKVTYHSDNEYNDGYRYVGYDKTMMYSGYTISYDVYLENDVAKIGAIELDDRYLTYSRDYDIFNDQNGLRGHPHEDISDYAYHKWYHRELALPLNWNGKGFANFYIMAAYEDGFVGDATAYFDNITIYDASGKVVSHFFTDGGSEYHPQNDGYTWSNYNNITCDVVSLSNLNTVSEKASDLMYKINMLPNLSDISTSDSKVVSSLEQQYYSLDDNEKRQIANFDILASAKEKLGGKIKDNNYGDLDRNGEITITDALIALQALVNKISLDSTSMRYAIVSGNDTLSTVDVLLILQYTVDKISDFPVQR